MNKLLKTIIEEQYNIKLEDKNISTYQDIIDLGIDLEKLVDDIYNKLEENPNKELIEVLEYLSNLNYPPAIRKLGLCYYNGILCYYNGIYSHRKGYTKVLELYKKVADLGNASDQFNLGNIYAYISEYCDLYQDIYWYTYLDQAIYWYTKAARQGHIDAQYTLGLIYDDEDSEYYDLDQAIYWYTEAANQGHASAQNNLALMYEKVKESTKTYSKP